MNIRLCYASNRNENRDDLLQDLRDILTEARDFNTRHCIYGVLYYADNAFFQCLEGEQHIVEHLFEKIKTDARHLDVKHFSTHYIDDYTFKRWSMKYVQRNTNIESFFLSLGEAHFNPLCLDEPRLKAFLEALLLAEQSTLPLARKVGMVNRGVNPF